MPSFEEYCEEIKEIWNSHWLTNMGVKHKELQKELENYLGISHVVLYTNGHLALENAIAALNLPKGGEVITTPFTFASTTHAIVRNGLVPVFCDIKEDDYTIDTQKLENLITDNTVAIVPVHVYGNMCDVEEINRISKKYGLKVIYDAAHAFAVKYKGESSACFGDASMFSFHATKVFNTIEGGCVCFKDDSWIQLLNDMKNFGIHGPESVQFVGANAKMNEFQAAMGICNLKHLDEEIEKRKHVVEHYRSRLEGVEGIKLSIIQKDVESNYAYFPVVFDGYKYTRNEIFEKLVEVGIGARKYFYPLPYFLCSSVADLCKKIKVDYEFYHIDERFEPVFDRILSGDEWLYIVNFYGQLDNDCLNKWKQKYNHVIVDNAQSYFQMPAKNVDTIYTCRKYFGVSDGAFLYTNTKMMREIPQDESFERMHFLLGRFERSANEFYSEYIANNKLFAMESVKKMSRLTDNLLHGIDYEMVAKKRQKNFDFLNIEFRDINILKLKSVNGAFMYPLLIHNGFRVRKKLQKEKVYIPTLWPNVLEECPENSLEYHYAADILPIPVDQRYGIEDMKYLVEVIRDELDR